MSKTPTQSADGNSPQHWYTPSLVLFVFIVASFIASEQLTRSDPNQAFYSMPSRLWELARCALSPSPFGRTHMRPT